MDSDVNEIRTSLLAAIKRDRNMFIKAKIDPMFDSVRPQVDALLEEILQKTKVKAEKEIADAEFAFHKMKKWFNEDYTSSDDIPRYKLIRNKISGAYASSNDMQNYNSIRNKISDAKGNLKTQSYFGCDDALEIMSGTSEMVDEIQASIRTELNHSIDECTKYNKKGYDIENKNDYIIKKERRNFCIVAGIFCTAWCLHNGVGIMWSIIFGILSIYIFGRFVVPILNKLSAFGGTDSDVRDLELEQKKIKNQIRDLKCRIATAEESLL